MTLFREIRAALEIGLASALARPRHTLLIAFGFLIAGITLVVLLAIPAGLERVAVKTGLADIALVLPNGASDESSATFKSELAGLVGSLPGVAHDSDGKPLVSPQFVVDTRLRRTDGTTATVLVRGVTPMFWNVVGRAATMHSGARFHSGKDELISGIAAARGFVSLDTGATIQLHKHPWRVTGEFESGGGFWESQLWTNMAALQSTFNAQGMLTILWVKLTSPAEFETFNQALHDDPRTQGLHAVRQRAYYSLQTIFLQSFIHTVATGVAVTLGLGAILAIVNALGMALDARRRELAILRAVGFRRSALAIALLVEVLVVGIVCAVVVVLLGWVTVNGHEVGSSTFSSAVQFRMRIDDGVILWTLAYLLLLGVLSALWPAWHAVRAPLTKALQDE